MINADQSRWFEYEHFSYGGRFHKYLSCKTWEMGVNNMRRRKLRGDFTVKWNYKSDRDVNEWDTMHYDFVDIRRKVNDLTYAKLQVGSMEVRKTCRDWQRLGIVTWQLWRRSEHCSSRLNAQGRQWYIWTLYDQWSLNIYVITSSDEVEVKNIN